MENNNQNQDYYNQQQYQQPYPQQNSYYPTYGQQYQQQVNPYAQQNVNVVPAEYKPISAWGYFGYELLFAIPVVGFILLLVFAFCASNKNLKSFARSYFCWLLILLVLGVILASRIWPYMQPLFRQIFRG